MNDLELTGTCPLIMYTGGNDEYQLPTQRHREQQLHKTTATDLNSKKRRGKYNFKTTDKILKLYDTVPIEREIPFKRARNIATKNSRSNGQENSFIQNQLSLPILESNNSKQLTKTQILPLSNSLVNDCLEGIRHNEVKIRQLTSRATNNPYLTNDRHCVSKLNVLDKIRPCHPQLAKEINVNPEEALKINSLIPAERLKSTSISRHTVTFPNIENASQPNISTPKYWWEYLNQKIVKKMSTPLPCLHKMCKLCELNSEHGDIVKHTEQRKNALHIDLKRLTEVHNENWSSYGHYTKVHKLKYTKRQKNLLKNQEKQVEVDEDYLSVDVDKLMSIYRGPKSISDVIESRAVGGYINTHQDPNITHDCPQTGSGAYRETHSQVINNTLSNLQHLGSFIDTRTCLLDNSDNQNVQCQKTKSFFQQEKYESLQRPTTTNLRSCINFTSRKTCF